MKKNLSEYIDNLERNNRIADYKPKVSSVMLIPVRDVITCVQVVTLLGKCIWIPETEYKRGTHGLGPVHKIEDRRANWG